MAQQQQQEQLGPVMQDFTLKERRHMSGRAGGLGEGLVPLQDEPLVAGGHLSRQHTLHQQAPAEEQLPAPSAAPPTSKSHWVTSYQAQTAGESFQQRRPVGKRMVPGSSSTAATSSSVGGLFSTFGQSRVSDAERDRALQLGTTKASQHIPGFTGHIPNSEGQRGLHVQARDLDKSKPLITMNYNPNPGCTKRLK